MSFVIRWKEMVIPQYWPHRDQYDLSIFSIFCVVVLFWSSSTWSAEDSVESLIASLVSPNKMPVCDDSTDDIPRYGGSYDHAAQKKVLAARDALHEKGMVVFPELIKHVDDRRYSHTEQRQKTFWVNLDAGYVCKHIVALQVEVYQPLVILSPPDRQWLPTEQDELGEWWESHKHLSLREIQLEAAKWALDKQRNAQFRSKEQEIAVLGDLTRLVKRLESSDKPIQIDSGGRYVNEPDLKRTKWKR